MPTVHAHELPPAPVRRIGSFYRHPRRWVESMSRFGLVVRGIIYFVPGALALEWACGRPRHTMSQAGTIDMIGHQPLGRFLLAIVATGLAGYAAWGFVRAVFDPLHRGTSPVGLVLRTGYLTSGFAYLGFTLATLRLLAGRTGELGPGDWTARVLAWHYGAALLFAIGICWIFGSGLSQILIGWRRTFQKDMALDRLRPAERRWMLALGRIGLVSRGLVFTVIGILLVAASLHPQARTETGLDGALLEIARQPFGRALVALAGLGLMTFGGFSAMCARWLRMRRIRADHGSLTTAPQLP